MPHQGDQHRGSYSATTNPFLKDDVRPSISPWTAQKIAMLQSRLDKQLGPEFVSTRPGGGGSSRVSYIEGFKVVEIANEVFGFNGWSTAIKEVTIDFVDIDKDTNKVSLGLSVIVRVTLSDGTYHEDIGYGSMENSKGKAAAFEKAKKEGTTDAMKRALKNFGNLLGNCLYDKEYLSRIHKVKQPVNRFQESKLFRRADFGVYVDDLALATETRTMALMSRNASFASNKGTEADASLASEYGGDEFDDILLEQDREAIMAEESAIMSTNEPRIMRTTPSYKQRQMQLEKLQDEQMEAHAKMSRQAGVNITETSVGQPEISANSFTEIQHHTPSPEDFITKPLPNVDPKALGFVKVSLTADKPAEKFDPSAAFSPSMAGRFKLQSHEVTKRVTSNGEVLPPPTGTGNAGIVAGNMSPVAYKARQASFQPVQSSGLRMQQALQQQPQQPQQQQQQQHSVQQQQQQPPQLNLSHQPPPPPLLQYQQHQQQHHPQQLQPPPRTIPQPQQEQQQQPQPQQRHLQQTVQATPQQPPVQQAQQKRPYPQQQQQWQHNQNQNTSAGPAPQVANANPAQHVPDQQQQQQQQQNQNYHQQSIQAQHHQQQAQRQHQQWPQAPPQAHALQQSATVQAPHRTIPQPQGAFMPSVGNSGISGRLVGAPMTPQRTLRSHPAAPIAQPQRARQLSNNGVTNNNGITNNSATTHTTNRTPVSSGNNNGSTTDRDAKTSQQPHSSGNILSPSKNKVNQPVMVPESPDKPLMKRARLDGDVPVR